MFICEKLACNLVSENDCCALCITSIGLFSLNIQLHCASYFSEVWFYVYIKHKLLFSLLLFFGANICCVVLFFLRYSLRTVLYLLYT